MLLVDVFSSVARQALVLCGLTLFLEVLLPQGGMKKTARLVMGLLVLGALLTPMAALYDEGVAVTADIFLPPQDNTEEIITAGGRLAGQAADKAAESLAADIERQLSKFVALQDGVTDCEVEIQLMSGDLAEDLGYNWGRVTILLSVDEQQGGAAEIADKVRQSVAAFYDLSEAEVRVSVVEYGDG